jgi:hypothetical protein
MSHLERSSMGSGWQEPRKPVGDDGLAIDTADLWRWNRLAPGTAGRSQQPEGIELTTVRIDRCGRAGDRLKWRHDSGR